MKTFEDFIRLFSDYVRRITLEPAARDSVRERLAAYADMHALSGTLPERSRLSPFSALNFRVFQAGFAVILIAASMGGVAYASSSALPGDRLYAVKTNFVEPLETALLYDAEARATWNAILAERRLSEAATLATAGRLDEATRAALEERFTLHAERSHEAAREVEASGNVAVALKVHSDLEARLSAHVDLFSYLALDEARPEAGKLLAQIAERRDRVAAERQEAEVQVAERALAYGSEDIEAAERTTEEVARLASTNGEAEGTIDARIIAARAALQSARASSERGEGGIAFVATQVAARLTHEASILAKNRGILALRPTADPAAASEPAAKERPGAPAVNPAGTVMLLTLPVEEEDVATTTEEEAPEEEAEKGASEDAAADSRTDTSSQDSQEDEVSTNDSDTTRVQRVIRSVFSPLGLQ